MICLVRGNIFFLYQHLQEDKTIIQFRKQIKRKKWKYKSETKLSPMFTLVKYACGGMGEIKYNIKYNIQILKYNT